MDNQKTLVTHTRFIKTEFYRNEITNNDWTAKLDGVENSAYGYGSSEIAAIKDLLRDLVNEEI